MGRQKQYYAFTRPGAMVGHRYTDDVALCKAINFRQAKQIFSRYYADIKDEEIRCLTPTKNKKRFVVSDIIILTDY